MVHHFKLEIEAIETPNGINSTVKLNTVGNGTYNRTVVMGVLQENMISLYNKIEEINKKE